MVKIYTNFKRLGAYYYKINRHFYELHKCCCFKFGCTLIVVMIQIMCNKKYKCQKTKDSKLNVEKGSSSDEPSDNENKQKIQKKKKTKTLKHASIKMNDSQLNNKKRVSIEEDLHESVVVGQPTFCYPSICKHTYLPTCTHPTPCSHSNLPFSPSFNLEPNKKSTPKSCLSNCNFSQNIPMQTNCTNLPFQNTQTCSQNFPNHSTPKQTQTVKADIHKSPLNVSNIDQNNESFQSC